MRSSTKIIAAVLATLLVTSYLSLKVAASGEGQQPSPAPSATPHQQTVFVEDTIAERDSEQNGIVVGEPSVYDDALLQQMLQAAEARLATLQLIDQARIAANIGAVTGASQQTSSLGVNVQGAPVPQVVTTTKLPTETTTENTAAGATTSSVQTVSNLAVQDVQTTRSAFSPPPANAPAPTATLPSSGFSVSSSDILNEQLQLTAEINALRLMLAGDLSSHFIRRGDNTMTKLKTTLGFPITLSPDRRHKDAVAVVEVEVERAGQALSTEPPAVTALLPREKTYNVAAITDRNTSIGGGVATQILGFSGSWVRGHKTYYLVQDQDTVALSFQPDGQGKVGFLWEFRPVLGRKYVKSGLKQTFVQLAFPAPSDAKEGEIGKVRVRTYWRKYDRKNGIHGKIIEGSVSKRDVYFDIPRYSLATAPPAFNPLQSLEDLGGGQMLVKLQGRFLPGTYVRIGATPITEGPQLKHEHFGIRFVAPISDLATKRVFLVSHDGTEVPLRFDQAQCHRPVEAGGVVSRARLEIIEGERRNVWVDRPRREIAVEGPRVTTIDEKNSRLSLYFVIRKQQTVPPEQEIIVPRNDEIPGLVLLIGSRVFGYSDGPIELEDGKLSAVVPSALLAANPNITLQLLLPVEECRASTHLPAFDPPSQTERLVVLEQGGPKIRFLLYGTRLSGLRVIEPTGVTPKPIGEPGDADRLSLIELDPSVLQNNKYLLVQRPGDGERPFQITLPELAPPKPAPPTAKERVTVNADEAIIVGDGMNELEGVTFRGQAVTFKVIDNRNLRLTGLRALGATSEAATQQFSLKFKGEAKPKGVDVEVINTKVETFPK
jgi:hypothetical protein